MVDWSLVNGGSCEDGSSYNPRPQDQEVMQPTIIYNHTPKTRKRGQVHTCSDCSTTMVVREGKFGKFWACPNSTPKLPHATKSIPQKPKRSKIYFGGEDDMSEDWGFNGGFC